MIAEIASHREELEELCRRFHVRRLDLFGSAASDGSDAERSDLDFLVEFEPMAPEALSFKTFFDLKQALEAVFGRNVDLVEPARFAIPISKRASSARASPSLRRDAKSLGQATILHPLRHSWSARTSWNAFAVLAPRPRMRPTRRAAAAGPKSAGLRRLA